ncbi:MAG: CHASE4 domain-containing protein, partial [Pseudomonas marincola]
MLEEKLVEAQAKVKKRIQELIFPLLVFVVGVFAVLFFGILQSVNELDRSDIKASETLFHAILLDHREQLRGLVVDSSYWDAAVTNLVLEFNSRWAENNVGTYLHEAHTLSGTYVVDDVNQTIYSVQNSETTRVDTLTNFPGIEDFLELVRLSHRDGSADTGLTEIRKAQNGKLYFIAGAVINPDFTLFNPAEGKALRQKRYVLLLTKTLDQLYLDNISRWYPYPKIMFEVMPVETAIDTSSWEFISIDGTAIGWATWQMPLNGDEVLASTLKTISISLLGLVVLIIYIIFKGMDLNRIASQG